MVQNSAKTPPHGPASLNQHQEGFNSLYPFRHGQAHQIIANHNDNTLTQVIQAYGEFSPGEVDVFQEVVQAGDTVVEVGANIGAHTLALAKVVGHGMVLAFEPQRLIFQTLCGNLALNSVSNVWAEQRAVGAKAGTAVITALDPYYWQNFGGLPINFTTQGETVEQIALDQLELPRCNFIKADCEGSELAVLQGAEATIQRLRPWLYIEFDHHRQDILDWLASHNYLCARHFPCHGEGSIVASDMLLAWHTEQLVSRVMFDGSFTTKHGFMPATAVDMLIPGVPKEMKIV